MIRCDWCDKQIEQPYETGWELRLPRQFREKYSLKAMRVIFCSRDCLLKQFKLRSDSWQQYYEGRPIVEQPNRRKRMKENP